MQVIDAPGAVTLELIDLSRQADPEDRARRVVDQQTQAPFDVAQGSPLRALLIRLGSEDHILQIVIHHIAADGWSKAVLFGELGALYPAFADDRPSPLPELPVQYGDFAEWQRSWLQGGAPGARARLLDGSATRGPHGARAGRAIGRARPWRACAERGCARRSPGR